MSSFSHNKVIFQKYVNANLDHPSRYIRKYCSRHKQTRLGGGGGGGGHEREGRRKEQIDIFTEKETENVWVVHC
jgi:hypothetical protein